MPFGVMDVVWCIVVSVFRSVLWPSVGVCVHEYRHDLYSCSNIICIFLLLTTLQMATELVKKCL
jgi:hypothetical protein